MEGPLLLIKAWLMSLAAIWVYRRFFERVAAPTPEFEAFCRSGAVLAAIDCKAGRASTVRDELRQRLSAKTGVGATLGGWPWPNYALFLSVAVEQDFVLLSVVGCSLLKTREPLPPSLIGILTELKARLPEAADIWIHPGLNYGGARHDPERSGWRLEESARSGLEPAPALGAWRARAAALPATAQQPPSKRQKVGRQYCVGSLPHAPIG